MIDQYCHVDEALALSGPPSNFAASCYNVFVLIGAALNDVLTLVQRNGFKVVQFREKTELVKTY